MLKRHVSLNENPGKKHKIQELNILDLPKEILLHIINFCDDKQDILNFIFTCKLFRDVVYNLSYKYQDPESKINFHFYYSEALEKVAMNAALHIVLKKDNLEAFKVILKKGFAFDEKFLSIYEKSLKPNIKEYSEKITQLMNFMLKSEESDEYTQSISKLLEEIDVNILTKRLEDEESFTGTLAHTASRCSNQKALMLLLEKGIDINIQDCHGDTILIINIDRLNLSKEHQKIAIFLINHPNIALDLQNEIGNTALMSAASNKEIVKLLLEKGADTSLKNNDDITALDMALKDEYKDQEIIDMLQSAKQKSSNKIIATFK